jgi:hypothetical protein
MDVSTPAGGFVAVQYHGPPIKARPETLVHLHAAAKSLDVANPIHMAFCGPDPVVVVVDAGDIMTMGFQWIGCSALGLPEQRTAQVFLLDVEKDCVVGHLMPRLGAWDDMDALQPRSVVCTPDGHRIFVTVLGQDDVRVQEFDRHSLALQRSIALGPRTRQPSLLPTWRGTFVDICLHRQCLQVVAPRDLSDICMVSLLPEAAVVTRVDRPFAMTMLGRSSDLSACWDASFKCITMHEVGRDGRDAWTPLAPCASLRGMHVQDTAIFVRLETGDIAVFRFTFCKTAWISACVRASLLVI